MDRTAAAGTRADGARHEPALDGLRGLAVLAVLAFHDGRLAGGFLGVSAFFTLSGFLVTRRLLAEAAADAERGGAGRVRLGRFAARRVRRLAPAAILGVALAAVVTAATAGPRGAPGFRGDGLAALGGVANWRFVLDDRAYADLFRAPSAVTHFWSLAVEEQCYLLLAPVVALALARARRPRAVLAGVFGAAAVAGVAVGWVLAGDTGGVTRAYYGTDVRAAEVLVGALAALAVTGTGASAAWLRAGARRALPLALAVPAVGVVAARTTDVALFRGGLVVHALATAVVVVGACEPTRLARALGVAPLRALGRISYGVYVYHWPVFLLLDPARTRLSGWDLTAVRLGVTAALAVVSYVLVEQPVRSGRRLTGVRPLVVGPLAAGAAVLAVVVAAAAVPPAITFEPALDRASRPTPVDRDPDQPASDVPPRPGEMTPVDPGGLPPERVLVVGDSVALTLGRGIERWGAAHGIEVRNGGAIGCTLLYDARVRGYWGDGHRPHDPCRTRETWPEIAASFRPDVVVVLFGAWDVYDASFDGGRSWHRPGDPVFDARYTDVVETSLAPFLASGARVVWLAPPCFEAVEGDPAHGGDWYEPERVRALGRVAEQVARRNGMAVSHELARRGCPVDWDERPDGAHFGDPGADAATAALLPAILGSPPNWRRVSGSGPGF